MSKIHFFFYTVILVLILVITIIRFDLCLNTSILLWEDVKKDTKELEKVYYVSQLNYNDFAPLDEKNLEEHFFDRIEKRDGKERAKIEIVMLK